MDSPGGLYCIMSKPIDFELVRGLHLEPGVELSEVSDTIFDRKNWISIYGSSYTPVDVRKRP